MGSAGRYFRAEIPARSVRPKWSSSVANFVLSPETLKEIRLDPRLRGWDGPGSAIVTPSVITLRIMDDVAIDTRTGGVDTAYHRGSMAGEIYRARDRGQVVLYDIDDDLWHIPEWSPAARAMHKLDPSVRAYDLEVIRSNIMACDGIITSTAYLVDIICKEDFGVPVYLQRPGIDPRDYAVPKTTDRPLRVGWMGSMSHHLPHLRIIMDALDVLPKYGAEFVHMGHTVGDGSHRALRELPCEWTQLPWGDVQTVPGKLAQVDIGLIPRMPDSFHEGQSVTSGLQYACAGVPFLVSPSHEYERLERKGAGKVCRTVNDWRQALEDLLEFPGFRKFEADRARECVEVGFGLEATGRRYTDLLECVTRGHQ